MIRFEALTRINLFLGIVDSMRRIVVEWTIALVRDVLRPKALARRGLLRREIGAMSGQIGERSVALISHIVGPKALAGLPIFGREISAMGGNSVEWRVGWHVTVCRAVVVRLLQFPWLVIGWKKDFFEGLLLR